MRELKIHRPFTDKIIATYSAVSQKLNGSKPIPMATLHLFPDQTRHIFSGVENESKIAIRTYFAMPALKMISLLEALNMPFRKLTDSELADMLSANLPDVRIKFETNLITV